MMSKIEIWERQYWCVDHCSWFDEGQPRRHRGCLQSDDAPWQWNSLSPRGRYCRNLSEGEAEDCRPVHSLLFDGVDAARQ